MKIVETMNLMKDYLIKGFRSGVIPLAILVFGLGSFLFLGSVGYSIFPTSVTEGKVIKFSQDARSNLVYEVAYKVKDKEYETFGFVTSDNIEIGQSCSVIYYDYFPSYSKIYRKK